MRLAPVERLGGLAEPAGEAVVDERQLQDAFEGFEGGLVGVFSRVGREGGMMVVVGLGVGRLDVLGLM